MINSYEFDNGCELAIATDDTVRQKVEQLGKQQKQKYTQQIHSRIRFRKNFATLEKKANLQTRLI